MDNVGGHSGFGSWGYAIHHWSAPGWLSKYTVRTDALQSRQWLAGVEWIDGKYIQSNFYGNILLGATREHLCYNIFLTFSLSRRLETLSYSVS